jgi:hypothetical protein
LNFYYNSQAAKVSVLTQFFASRPADGIKLRKRSRLNFDFGRPAKILSARQSLRRRGDIKFQSSNFPAPFGRTLTKRS